MGSTANVERRQSPACVPAYPGCRRGL